MENQDSSQSPAPGNDKEIFSARDPGHSSSCSDDCGLADL